MDSHSKRHSYYNERIKQSLNDKQLTNTELYLKRKYEAERDYVPSGGYIGFSLDRYKQIADKLDGIQPGMHCIIAKANVGKTALLTGMAIDLVLANIQKDRKCRVIVYTLDDSIDDFIQNMVAFIANDIQFTPSDSGIVTKNMVVRKRMRDDYEQRVKKAYDALVKMSSSGFLKIRGIEDCETFEEIISQICIEKAEYEDLVILMDGLANIHTDKFPANRKVEQNDHKSLELKKICNILDLPVILTCETPKNAPFRPLKEDIKESVRYSFDSKVCICLSPVTNEAYTNGSNPIIQLHFDKNKRSGFKGCLYSVFRGACAMHALEPEEKSEGYRKAAAEFDKERKKMGLR